MGKRIMKHQPELCAVFHELYLRWFDPIWSAAWTQDFKSGMAP